MFPISIQRGFKVEFVLNYRTVKRSPNLNISIRVTVIVRFWITISRKIFPEIQFLKLHANYAKDFELKFLMELSKNYETTSFAYIHGYLKEIPKPSLAQKDAKMW